MKDMKRRKEIRKGRKRREIRRGGKNMQIRHKKGREDEVNKR